MLKQPPARALDEEEEREAPQGCSAAAAQLVGVALQMAVSLVSGVHRTRYEADQQLVYQPEKAALEAMGRDAVCGDGWVPSPKRCCCLPVHGWALQWRRPVSPWFLISNHGY
ncbi:homeobox protein [Musa troglodytarum]|uniref:Homeobox protein n=1 Tax=Musa troglodytarum TaxID=320322 RepID=A0A9E7L1F3_9LILI|nr:homeobox protein [Musa troglodytarum]